MTSPDPWAWGWDAVAAIATAGAAMAAVVIWRADQRRARRARAGRVTARFERRRSKVRLATGEVQEMVNSGLRLVVQNGSDAAAYDVNVRHPSGGVDPIPIGLLTAGDEFVVPAADELAAAHLANSYRIDTRFTMDERRWHLDAKGRLRGGRRDRRKDDPPVEAT